MPKFRSKVRDAEAAVRSSLGRIAQRIRRRLERGRRHLVRRCRAVRNAVHRKVVAARDGVVAAFRWLGDCAMWALRLVGRAIVWVWSMTWAGVVAVGKGLAFLLSALVTVLNLWIVLFAALALATYWIAVKVVFYLETAPGRAVAVLVTDNAPIERTPALSISLSRLTDDVWQLSMKVNALFPADLRVFGVEEHRCVTTGITGQRDGLPSYARMGDDQAEGRIELKTPYADSWIFGKYTRLVVNDPLMGHVADESILCGFTFHPQKTSYFARKFDFAYSDNIFERPERSSPRQAKISFALLNTPQDLRILTAEGVKGRDQDVMLTTGGLGQFFTAQWTEDDRREERDLLLLLTGTLFGIMGGAFIECLKDWRRQWRGVTEEEEEGGGPAHPRATETPPPPPPRTPI